MNHPGGDIFTFLEGGGVDEVDITNWFVGGMVMLVSIEVSEGKSQYLFS